MQRAAAQEMVDDRREIDDLIGFQRRLRSLRVFIRFDLWGSASGALVLLVAGPIITDSVVLFVLLGPLLLLSGLLIWSRRKLSTSRHVTVGDIEKCLAAVTAGNWIVAIGVTWLLPFLWPVMVLTTVMTVVLVTPHLTRARLAGFIVAVAILGSFLGLLGVLRDDDGAIEDIDDTLELVVVTCAVAAQIIPIGLLSWQANDLHRQAFLAQLDLNESLRDSQRNLAEHSRLLAESRRRVVEASTVERSRIERDLHDGAQQQLAAIGIRLRLLQSTTQNLDESLYATLDGLVADLEQATEELRELAHGIYPPLLEQRGISVALRAVVRRSPLTIDLQANDIGRQEQSVESALYFSCLEALANVQKYAPDSRVAVSLRQRGSDELELMVVDDGPGFDTNRVLNGRGIQNMADRLGAAEGTLDVASKPGKGTKVTARVPTRIKSADPRPRGTSTPDLQHPRNR